MKLRNNVVAVAELDFSGLDVARLHDPTPHELGQLGAELLEHKYRELLSLFDMDELSARLFAWVRVNVDLSRELSIPEQLAYSELGILTLLDRGVIAPVIPLESAPEALANFEQLRQAVAKSGLRPAPAAAVAAVALQPAAIDPIDQCINDYRILGSTDFRKRWMTGDARAVYDRACASGRI